MRRRELMMLLGGATVWPLAAHAQQPARLPRIGHLSLVSESQEHALGLHLKTAKALGLDIPPLMLANADEVIE